MKKWANPVKQFKVGSVDYSSEFKARARHFRSMMTDSKLLLTGKIAVKPSPGWKLTSLTTHKTPFAYGSEKKVVNGAKVKKRYWVQAAFENRKTGLVEHVSLWSFPLAAG